MTISPGGGGGGGGPPRASGAANAAAAAAAAAAASGRKAPIPPAPPPPRRGLFESLTDRLNQDSGTVRQTAQKWAQQAGGAFKGFQMPVRVDVDFFGPILDTAQKTAITAWRRLPPGAQAAAPYAGTALASGGAAWAVQGRRLRRARSALEDSDAAVHALTAERGKLQDAIKTLRAGALAPRTPSELKAAAAVAETTAAAAAAASAAAAAAQACVVYIQRGGRLAPRGGGED